MVDYVSLGNRIRMKRRARKMSQKDVAQFVQISASSYGNIERGLRVPSLDTLVDIANILECSLDFLLADSLHSTQFQQRSPDEMRVLVRYLRERVAELDYGDMIQQQDFNPFAPREEPDGTK